MEGMIKLANGEQYTGHWHGDRIEVSGELIFYTGMGNFNELMTDPAVKGKVVLTTYPGIFNCMIDAEKFESDEWQPAALITQHEPHTTPTNWIEALSNKNIPVMTGVDSRSILKELINLGESPVFLSAANSIDVNLQENRKEHSSYISKVMNPHGKKHLVVIDLGLKKSLVNWLTQFDFKLTILSSDTSIAEINVIQPDGVVFSGGPGDPRDWQQHYHTYSEIAKTYPTIGFGLGHQILALSFGATVEKMKLGHRNYKHGIIHEKTNRVYMSKQNHGFSVSSKNLEKSHFKPTFTSIQDGAIEGLIHDDWPITTYQFHPDGKNSALEEVMIKTFSHQLSQHKGVKVYA